MISIRVYSTPICPYCNMVKDYLKKNEIEFEEVDVAADQVAAQEMIKNTGQMGVPVVAIDKDSEVKYIVGFDQAKLAELLDIKK